MDAETKISEQIQRALEVAGISSEELKWFITYHTINYWDYISYELRNAEIDKDQLFSEVEYKLLSLFIEQTRRTYSKQAYSRQANLKPEKSVGQHIKGVLDIAELGLDEDDLKRIENKAIKLFEAYRRELNNPFEWWFYPWALNVKEGLRVIERRFLAIFKAFYSSREVHPPNIKVESIVRDHVRRVLGEGALGLSQVDQERVEDQMIGLFGYYSSAPEDKRDEVYTRGEERIMSIFDPPGQSQGVATAGKPQ